MQYRRADVPGATYFFTVNIADRETSLLLDHVDVLRETTRKVRQNHPFNIDAMVVLPDHLHAPWTLPNGDADFSMRWGLIKAGFSRAVPKIEPVSPSRISKGERGLWQRRFWEHQIRDERDFARHVDYIHYNPVKHGYVKQANQWPYSSIHRFIAKGLIGPDWACHEAFAQSYGE